MAYELLGRSLNNTLVVYDIESSHAANHFADTPCLKELAREIIAQTRTTGEYMWFETDMGRIVGRTDLVETVETDDIIYAKRPGRGGYTRFVLGCLPRACSVVTVAMQPIQDEQYELVSAWIGPIGVPFPDDPAATAGSQEYWARHALVWGTQEVVPGTERSDNPWIKPAS